MMSKKTFSFLILMLVSLWVIAPVALANKITLRVTDANHTGPKEPTDVSAEAGIQVLAGTRVTVTLTSAEPLNGATIDTKRISPINNVNGDFEIDGAWVAATPETPVSGTGIERVNASKYTINFTADANSPVTDGKEVTLWVLPRAFTSATTGDNDSTGATIKFKYVRADNSDQSTTPVLDQPDPPKVVSITRATAIGSTVRSAFIAEVVKGEFLVKVVLTEKPNGGLHSMKHADRIKALSVSAGAATNVVIGQTIEYARGADGTFPAITATNAVLPYQEGMYDMPGGTPSTPPDPIPFPTGRDQHYYTYLATIVPDGSKDEVIIQVNDFKDLVLTQGEGGTIIEPGMYRKPSVKAAEGKPGREILKVKVEKAPAAAKTAGLKIAIPNDTIVPAGGFLIIARNDGSGDNDKDKSSSTQIIYPGDSKVTPILVGDRQPAQQLYNLIAADLPNLETFLGNGGTIDVISPGLVVSEIMWGSDASLDTPSHNQWIELYNAGGEYKAKDAALMFYGRGEAPAKTSGIFPTVAEAVAAPKELPAGVSDRVGTLDDNDVWWTIANKGQPGRTGQGETAGELRATIPTQAVASMYRVMVASTATGAAVGAMMPERGNISAGWMQSRPPAVNFNLSATGVRIGSPGAATQDAFATPPLIEEETPMTAVATATDIMITEIMVDTGSGRLPQWIELTNVSGAEKSLAGWSLMITNDATDDGVIGATVNINLSGTLGVGGGEDAGGTMGKSLLLVGGTARSSSNLAGSDRVVDISSQVDQRGRYKFISSLGFMAALIPPQKTGILAYGDTAGNLDGGWDLPMDESGRSSLIRREMLDNKMATMGTDANGWILASSTPLVRGPATWYGSDEDAGTPGYDAGGPLPVELSHFRPARDKATGAVVITWSTQSELNNAGFFIKRSQQRNGQFKVINATMVAGAGTTSEKQFYTYTDTTAQPNVVYYYQIEDVSLDGNRQTLTHGIRLKGHIGAAGKLTTTWGDLKTSHE